MYIGNRPTVGNFVKLDTITATATTTFNLLNGGVAYYPQSANHCLVSLNGILQAPTDSFTISGSTIIFSSALTTSDVIDFIIVLGDVLNIGTPSDNTVSLAKLTATGTKDATTFLRGDNTFATVVSGLTEADQWRLTTDFTGTADITANLERPDTYGLSYMGTGMTQSSGIFTFPSTGYWLITFNTNFVNPSTNIRVFWNKIYTTTDNSTYNSAVQAFANSYDFSSEHHTSVESKILFDVTNTTTHKVKFGTGTDAEHIVTDGDTNINYTYMTFIRLGNT